MKALTGGVIVTKNQMIYGKTLLFDSKIRDITSENSFPDDTEIIDVHGNMIVAGFIDLHIHGYGGFDVSDGSTTDIQKMGSLLTANGVTSWCPTTMTIPENKIQAAFDAVREAKETYSKYKWHGAEILGINCEGPFISPEKAGAQDTNNIKAPNAEFIIKNKDILRLVTLAPEMDEGFEFIKKIRRETGVVVSIGHTNASYDTAKAAFDAGATHATHLYNAMTPLSHRNPGVTGAALTEKHVSCELIADTFHVHPKILEMTALLKKNKLVLITDCMRAGGLPDGSYTLGGQAVFVKGIECRLKSGVIAGSVLKMNEAVRNMANNTSLPIWEIINMASLNPASVIGESDTRGSIEIEKQADITVITKNIDVCMTIVHGNVCYENIRL